jgi:hypothetical protein
MSWKRKSWYPAKASYSHNALAVLRCAVIGSVDFSEVDTVTGLNNGTEEFEDKPTVRAGKEALNILEHKSIGEMLRDQCGIFCHQRIPLVVGAAMPRRRESLARWSTDEDTGSRQVQ